MNFVVRLIMPWRLPATPAFTWPLAVKENRAEGKVAVLCLAESEGEGIEDPEKRARIGDDRITAWSRLFARARAGELT